MAGAVRAERGDGAGAAVLRAGGRGAEDGVRAGHAPHRLRRLPPGDRRRHAPPRVARRQGVHAAAHGRRRAGLRAALRGVPSHVSRDDPQSVDRRLVECLLHALVFLIQCEWDSATGQYLYLQGLHLASPSMARATTNLAPGITFAIAAVIG